MILIIVLFRVFLTRFNQIFLYFCVVMINRKKYFTRLTFFILCFASAFAFAQNAKTYIDAPEKLDELLQIKVGIDKKTSEEKQYTIQVHYGDFESTTTVLEEFGTLFPDLPSKLIFETPNYKVRAGQFATEREALKILVKVKRRFSSAFVLKP